MERFTLLDHPADIGFLAFGRTLEEMFANAALALMACGFDLDTIEPREPVALRATGTDREALLYNWLAEILYLSDAEGWVFSAVEVSSLSEGPPLRVEGIGRGDRFNKSRHRARTYIKAVTYHQLSIEQKDGLWQARVFLDV